MPLPVDVLNTSLNDLEPKFAETFLKFHPLTELIMGGKRMDRGALKGPIRLFDVVTGGPGFITNIQSGSERIRGGLNQTSKQGQAHAPRNIYAFDVPAKSLDEVNGPNDMARILEQYPFLGLEDYKQRHVNQLASGAASDDGTALKSFLTLNGDQNYESDGTSRDGVFQFATPANQNNTVFGLAMQGAAAGVTGWFHQYDKMNSFRQHGLRKLRKIQHLAAIEGGKAYGPIDLMLSDIDSFENYLETQDLKVETMAIKEDSAVTDASRIGMKFFAATWYYEEALDTATATTGSRFNSGAGRAGVIYGLNSKTWHAFTHGGNPYDKGPKDFKVRPAFRMPEQDLYRVEIVVHLGIFTNNLRANFVIEGSANE